MQAFLVAKKRTFRGSLGVRVRAILDEQDRSVTWLAEATGITRASISRIINEQVGDPSVSIVRKIAEALDVSIGDLLDT